MGVLLGLVMSAWAAPVSARVGIQQQSVFVGEVFKMQIIVDNSSKPEVPDLSAMNAAGFTAQFAGGGAQTSMTVVQGRVSQKVSYVFNYNVIANREGSLTIPSLTVKAEGQTVQTAPVQLIANKGAETNDFKIRIKFSKNRVYVGEPVRMEVILYHKNEIRRSNLNLPFLSDSSFHFYNLECIGLKVW